MDTPLFFVSDKLGALAEFRTMNLNLLRKGPYSWCIDFLMYFCWSLCIAADFLMYLCWPLYISQQIIWLFIQDMIDYGNSYIHLAHTANCAMTPWYRYFSSYFLSCPPFWTTYCIMLTGISNVPFCIFGIKCTQLSSYRVNRSSVFAVFASE